MLVVTGGAGFIGSNVISRINKLGGSNILIVDDLTKSEKFKNLLGLNFRDLIDYESFLESKTLSQKNEIKGIIHLGACTDTTEYNGRLMLKKNYEYSVRLLSLGKASNARFIYASSASIYGNNVETLEEPKNENPLNIYAFSKLLFDNYVRRITYTNQLIGLRFFNVFGPGEQFKGKMSSMIFKLIHECLNDGTCTIFKEGDQMRDFVHVDDVVDVILFYMDNNIKTQKGIFNVGTGIANSFNDVARCILGKLGGKKIIYIDFPLTLKDKYQSYTRADLRKLRESGYKKEFSSVQTKIEEYCDYVRNFSISQ